MIIYNNRVNLGETLYKERNKTMTLYSRKTKTKELNFRQNIDCPNCNRPGSLRAFKSFRQFSINFIPLFKYKKQWYLETTCCGKKYLLSEEVGKQIEAGIKKDISLSELR